MKKTFVLSILILAGFNLRADVFDSLRQPSVQRRPAEALAAVKKISSKQLPSEDQRWIQFARGVFEFQNHQWSNAIKTLKGLGSKQDPLNAYVRYHLGLSFAQQNELRKAKKELALALTLEPSMSLRNQIQFELSDIETKLKNWNAAFKLLSTLSRSWRNSDKEPLVLWRLLQVDLQLKGKKSRACRWAERLYSKYPSHPIVYDWGFDLDRAFVQGEKLGCNASMKSSQERIKRLQWAGEGVRARKELDLFLKRSSAANRYIADELFAEFQIQAGFVKEAVEILKPHYPKKKSDYDFLSLMAKALSRSFEYLPAAGMYQQAAALDPKSLNGRKAKFLEAFQAYQFQDYDSALRGFNEIIDTQSESYLTRDSRWYRAWVLYLRNDFELAREGFDELLKIRRKSRSYARAFPEERLRYWSALSLLKKGEEQKAARELMKLKNLFSSSYYGVAARARLEKLELSVKEMRTISSELVDSAVIAADDSSSEVESESLLVEEEVVVTDNGEEILQEPKEEVLEFAKPKLQQRYSLAMGLAKLGFLEWSRDELYEIERRTKNRKELERLVEIYAQVEGYRRSAYLSETFFRTQWGDTTEKSEMMKRAFPQAYLNSVDEYSKAYGVDRETIWSIMRAESYYRPEIRSPVGATGLMQLMPYTADQVASLLSDSSFTPDQLVLPETNIRYGSRYLQRLEQRWSKKLPLVAASYNAGPHRVDLWLSQFGHLEMDEFIEHIPFSETRNYVKKVSRYYSIYRDLYSDKKSETLAWLASPVGVAASERISTRETW